MAKPSKNPPGPQLVAPILPEQSIEMVRSPSRGQNKRPRGASAVTRGNYGAENTEVSSSSTSNDRPSGSAQSEGHDGETRSQEISREQPTAVSTPVSRASTSPHRRTDDELGAIKKGNNRKTDKVKSELKNTKSEPKNTDDALSLFTM